MAGIEVKNLGKADDVRSFEHGDAEVVQIGSTTVVRSTFKPGWRWSTDVKPIAGTESCQVLHTGYTVSGRIHVRSDDGTEADLGPGDAYVVQPGHDAWVVGDEAWIGLDFSAQMAEYAKKLPK